MTRKTAALMSDPAVPPPASASDKQQAIAMMGVLLEDLVEEVLLRFPSDNPASLIRAALVSKRWCHLIAGRSFRRRFREVHGAGPMLGLIYNFLWDTPVVNNNDAHLIPTSSCLPRVDHRRRHALDSRHGRVLLSTMERSPLDPFVIWNPITGEFLELPSLPLERCYYPHKYSGYEHPILFEFNATVLCATCAHLDNDCCHGHFLVVYVGTYEDGVFTYVYSSDAGVWSEPSIVDQRYDMMNQSPAALVGNAVYFSIENIILKYDLGTHENTVLDMPPESIVYERESTLLTTKQDKFGLAIVDDFKLYIWTIEVGPQGDPLWTQDRVIELQSLLPADVLLMEPNVVGYVHGHGIVLVGTSDVVLFAIDLNLNQATKVGEGIPIKDDNVGLLHFYYVVPYTSVYFPALGAAVPFSDNQERGHQVHDALELHV